MNFKYCLLWAVSLLFLASCGEEEESPQSVVLPENLVVTVTQSDENPSDVRVTATATLTNFYSFNFGDGSEVIEQNSGTLAYRYPESGTYTITVQAHATALNYIEKSETVVIPDRIIDPNSGYSTPESYDGMTLVWADEFNGTSLNTADWTYELGAGGWGNNELQTYTNQNATVSDGLLSIEAKRAGGGYSSSRIVTQNKRYFKYGRIDIRALLPEGQGYWPALWMLGQNFSSVGWPACGEIDIMEMIGGNGRENTVHGTLHWQDPNGNSNNNNHASSGEGYRLSEGTFSEKFHVYTIIWDQNSINWYVDDRQSHGIDITGANLSEFQEEFFFIFNVAVGGNWPGDPDASTVFPQSMKVDYVRVFQDN